MIYFDDGYLLFFMIENGVVILELIEYGWLE